MTGLSFCRSKTNDFITDDHSVETIVIHLVKIGGILDFDIFY